MSQKPNSIWTIMALAGGILLLIGGVSYYFIRKSLSENQKLRREIRNLQTSIQQLEEKITSESSVSKPRELSLPPREIELPQEVRNLITQFEKYQQSRNAEKVLSLFTPPKTEVEQREYQKLYFDGMYRLYSANTLNYQVKSWKIISFQKLSEDQYKVSVEEVRDSLWDQTTGSWQKINQKVNLELTVVKYHGSWRIDKYTYPSVLHNPKYSGFSLGAD